MGAKKEGEQNGGGGGGFWDFFNGKTKKNWGRGGKKGGEKNGGGGHIGTFIMGQLKIIVRRVVRQFQLWGVGGD